MRSYFTGCAVANPNLVLEFITGVNNADKAYSYKPVSRLPAVFKVEELPFLPNHTNASSAVAPRPSSSFSLGGFNFTFRKLQRIPGPFLRQVIQLLKAVRNHREHTCIGSLIKAIYRSVLQVSVLVVNVTENVTLLVDFVQSYNFSKDNDSIYFLTPGTSFAGYSQMIVADAAGIETVAPDKLYYSEKVKGRVASH
jgi:hypothetical protein